MDNAYRYVPERVPNPRMPATKENLKYKYNKLGKELDAISSQYEDDVYSVIHDLKRRYNETRNWPLPCYGELKNVYKQYTTVVYQNPKPAVDAEKYSHMGLLGYCILKQAIMYKGRRSPRRDVEQMHKEEIEAENDDLKHHIRCYDCKFLRAQDTLRQLKESYTESKRYLPHLRYRRMKRMVETVIEDRSLEVD